MRRSFVAGLSRTALQTVLCTTTERLAGEIASPTTRAPDWSESQWLMARAVASMHGIVPLLAATLRWQGPTGWQRFLDEQTAFEQRRYHLLEALLRLMDERLRAQGIAAVALKGAALYAIGLYNPGQRPMADVDILVRSADLERASHVLGTLGFRESLRLWKNRLFSAADSRAPGSLPARGEHPIKVELHDRICEMLPARIVEVSALIFPAQASPGLNPYPSRASLMAHLLLHAAGSIVDRAVRLIQLQDIALLSGRMSDEDWAELLRSGQPAPWWAFPPLALTARYYPESIPQWVLGAARAHCPWILSRVSGRLRLSKVSLSFPWIGAFPGIAWTRSVGETLAYVASRIVPGTGAWSMREWASRTEPGLSQSERQWLHVSQVGRILRWVVSRPARPLTMRAVRRAFAEHADTAGA
jgi:hypothetical protein